MLASVGAEPANILSKRSKAYRARSTEIDAMDSDELLVAMVEESTLIRRPLVVADGILITGFDRKSLQELTGDDGGSET